jgi:hypothetical protein
METWRIVDINFCEQLTGRIELRAFRWTDRFAWGESCRSSRFRQRVDYPRQSFPDSTADFTRMAHAPILSQTRLLGMSRSRSHGPRGMASSTLCVVFRAAERGNEGFRAPSERELLLSGGLEGLRQFVGSSRSRPPDVVDRLVDSIVRQDKVRPKTLQRLRPRGWSVHFRLDESRPGGSLRRPSELQEARPCPGLETSFNRPFRLVPEPASRYPGRGEGPGSENISEEGRPMSLVFDKNRGDRGESVNWKFPSVYE